MNHHFILSVIQDVLMFGEFQNAVLILLFILFYEMFSIFSIYQFIMLKLICELSSLEYIWSLMLSYDLRGIPLTKVNWRTACYVYIWHNKWLWYSN